MKKSRQGFLKRQKELARQAKKRAKAERLAEARLHKGEGEEPDAGEDEGEVEGLDFHDLDGLPAASVDAVIRGKAKGDSDDEDDDKPDPDR